MEKKSETERFHLKNPFLNTQQMISSEVHFSESSPDATLLVWILHNESTRIILNMQHLGTNTSWAATFTCLSSPNFKHTSVAPSEDNLKWQRETAKRPHARRLDSCSVFGTYLTHGKKGCELLKHWFALLMRTHRRNANRGHLASLSASRKSNSVFIGSFCHMSLCCHVCSRMETSSKPINQRNAGEEVCGEERIAPTIIPPNLSMVLAGTRVNNKHQ